MSNVNDIKIMELKKQIEENRNKLNGVKRFVPITNCLIEFDDERYNIQVLSQEQLTTLLIKLNSYMISAKELGILDNYIISGYKAEEWFEDLKAKLDVLSYKQEERKLKEMESRLDKLLSDEKKTELELSSIEDMLK